MSRTIRFYDDADLLSSHGLHLAPAPVEKLGPVDFRGKEPEHHYAVFANAVIPWQGGWRLYYSDRGAYPGRDYHLAIAESADGLHWDKVRVGEDGYLHPRGLAPEERLVQQQAVPLPDGRVRIYFWWHGHDRGRARYVAADSDNGVDFEIVNLDDPCVFHPSDFNVGQSGFAAGLTAPVVRADYEAERTVPWLEAKRRRSNDATYVYYNERLRLFEMYSVWLAPNDAQSHHYTPHDNAPQIIRVMHRRTSDGGLLWSDPELIIIPDEHDPLDIQFYHMSVHELDDWRVGMLGHYRCWAQTMDLELCFSRDGRHWNRPLRGGFIPRGGIDEIDYYSIYPTNRLLESGDDWLMLYDGGNWKHNHQLPEGVETRRNAVMAARVPKRRLAGLQTTTGLRGTLEVKCIPGAAEITVDAAVRGQLRAELRDIFDRPLEGYHLDEAVPVQGDSTSHAIRWQGDRTSEPYRYDALILRLEAFDATIYGVNV
ncbi:MAG: hypothetical protein ABFD96_19850 [Armatimonadia bacterium]